MDLQKLIKYRKMGGFLLAFFILSILYAISSVFSYLGLIFSTISVLTTGSGDTLTTLISFLFNTYSIITFIIMIVFLAKKHPKFYLMLVLSTIPIIISSVSILFQVKTLVAITYSITENMIPYSTGSFADIYSGLTAFLYFYYIAFALGNIAWNIGILIYFKKSERFKIYSMPENEFIQLYNSVYTQTIQTQNYYGQYYPPQNPNYPPQNQNYPPQNPNQPPY